MHTQKFISPAFALRNTIERTQRPVLYRSEVPSLMALEILPLRITQAVVVPTIQTQSLRPITIGEALVHIEPAQKGVTRRDLRILKANKAPRLKLSYSAAYEFSGT